jgi:hypothetical protein
VLVDDLLKDVYRKGISELKTYSVDAIDIVYIDSTLANKIIDFEFKSSFTKKATDSVGIYAYPSLESTENIAMHFYNKYAAEKLYIKYKSLPKFIKSDTIYPIYYHLDKLLSIFLYYKPKGLKERLTKDYYEWMQLSKKAPVHRYPTPKEMGGWKYKDLYKTKKSDLYPDCKFIAFQLADALRLLHVPGFNKHLLEYLKKNQNYPYFRVYKSPAPKNDRKLNYHEGKTRIELTKSYPNVLALIKVEWGPKKRNVQSYKMSEYDTIDEIIYSKNNSAYLSISTDNGNAGYLVRLKGKYYTIKKLYETFEN